MTSHVNACTYAPLTHHSCATSTAPRRVWIHSKPASVKASGAAPVISTFLKGRSRSIELWFPPCSAAIRTERPVWLSVIS